MMIGHRLGIIVSSGAASAMESPASASSVGAGSGVQEVEHLGYGHSREHKLTWERIVTDANNLLDVEIYRGKG